MSEPPFSARARLQAMLDVEAALAEAEAAIGVIPRTAARSIRACARVDTLDEVLIESEAQREGNVAIPMIRQLTARVSASDAEAARYVHWGATSQDIIDTAFVLQLRAAVPRVIADLVRAADAAAVHAERHVKTTMVGRTWLQQATPVSFGLKAAGWCDSLDRSADHLESALAGACVLQFGGATGTLAALGDRGPEVAAGLGQTLGLSVPPIPWHSHRERFAVLACALGVATGAAGKIGRDLGLLAQTEIGEAHEPDTSAGGSSTMPHKQNPVRATIAIAAATRAPGLVSTMLSTMLQEHERGLGGWQAEWDTFPALVSTAGHAADAIAGALEALVVDPDRMRANVNMTGGLILAESIAMRLAPEMGKREAHAAIKRAARRAVGGESFADVLASDPAVSAILDRAAIEQALSPDDYLGSTEAFVAAVLSRRSQRKN
jgi:3-carboxy-cis,cis-muconate cycloisomerase